MFLPNLLKKLFILLIFLGLLSVVYNYAFFSPQQRKAELAYQKMRDAKLEACMTGSEDKYNGSWKQECVGYGYREGCRLPLDVASRIDGKRKFDKESCLEQYPALTKKEESESKSLFINPLTFFAPSE